MDSEVCRAHIDLYVNDASFDYGPEGEEAIERLMTAATDAGLVERTDRTLFWDR
jgi:1,4-dihydroxy-6-naphthoate synthase